MIVIAKITLITNILGALISFFNIFTNKTIADRVISFIACTINILTCITSIYVLKL
ncbi:hypothetical protein [uncultured Clostridium sp.]|uniref:hypothetical protein n=1 Tax=uncultured Clostridium sp. TaxID=59620 RepID=UPI002730662F|nr:hypothetical protein [uncultured Clostridium sp.]